ncbi:MAG: NapC/NirT family cytochrome c [Candidatus Krumholzibacteria bacterium]|nr:NapC/NirT family cytochrome c [Candidatus Krumholzibacteria bacterium]
MTKVRFPRLAYNKISMAGLALALMTALTIAFFLSVQSREGRANPYLGIFVYMVLPPFLLIGLLLVPVGMVRQWKRIRKYGKSAIPSWPLIDFNNTTHRNAFIVFLAGGLIYGVLSTVGAYQAYHHTESVSFCGQTCHSVMKPEHVAYQNSSHARVPCTACHVGEGAGWYAKSKLSGAYQVYATTLKKYPRPIPTPIKNLRPAQETCEQCHWPQKFFGGQQRQFNHHMYDEANTPWPINMLIKTGGGDPKTGQTAGIHWHMNIGVKVEYIDRDERRQDIPWIRVTDRLTGRVTLYQDEDNPLSEEEIQAATPRVMDCMDCHNRPSHKFRSPEFAVDRAILTGQIDRSLPSIKRVAVEAMAEEYQTEDEAKRSIATKIPDFYRSEHPQLFLDKRVAVEQAVVAAQQQFSETIFPEMKVRWGDYPDNIGHFIYPGCMRCHDGHKVSEEGWVISRECKTCHTILSQGSGERAEMASSQDGLEFVHPEDIDEEWRETGCYECHTGTQP